MIENEDQCDDYEGEIHHRAHGGHGDEDRGRKKREGEKREGEKERREKERREEREISFQFFSLFLSAFVSVPSVCSVVNLSL
ncbi:MAG: hypothetical protein JO034_00430 [Singulisphaera sp.]|nr:hypothetical protein [Singulisphaera sp.]